jgi:hypothetical protein
MIFPSAYVLIKRIYWESRYPAEDLKEIFGCREGWLFKIIVYRPLT